MQVIPEHSAMGRDIPAQRAQLAEDWFYSNWELFATRLVPEFLRAPLDLTTEEDTGFVALPSVFWDHLEYRRNQWDCQNEVVSR